MGLSLEVFLQDTTTLLALRKVGTWKLMNYMSLLTTCVQVLKMGITRNESL